MPNADFYANMPEELVAAMDARGARKAVIVRDLARYYGLLKQGIRSIDGLFTSKELHFLANISCGSVSDASYIDLLWFSVNDALVDILSASRAFLASSGLNSLPSVLPRVPVWVNV